MNKKNINILLSFEDNDGNYTRHVAVTILSLLETNKNNRIKIYIISSSLPQKNINELKRIVDLYNQEIEFILDKNIIPNELKNVMINKRSLSRGARYRLFFPKYIKGIDRILYMDCDILVNGDIYEIYNMNMHGKSIAGYYDIIPFSYKAKAFEVKNYINSGVLLFDSKKYDINKINVKKMIEINEKYGDYFTGCDQDKINIIFNNDITIGKRGMNYQVWNRFFNKGIDNAEIIHCIEKPYVQYSSVTKKMKELYYFYLNQTIWKGYPEQKAKYGYLKHLYISFYKFCYNFLVYILGENFVKKANTFRWEHSILRKKQ